MTKKINTNDFVIATLSCVRIAVSESPVSYLSKSTKCLGCNFQRVGTCPGFTGDFGIVSNCRIIHHEAPRNPLTQRLSSTSTLVSNSTPERATAYPISSAERARSRERMWFCGNEAIMELKAGYICDRGLNPKRPVNQDRFLAIPERGLFAVFDGVGGQRAGEVASQTAAETIEEAITHASMDGNSVETIRRAIDFAN